MSKLGELAFLVAFGFWLSWLAFGAFWLIGSCVAYQKGSTCSLVAFGEVPVSFEAKAGPDARPV